MHPENSCSVCVLVVVVVLVVVAEEMGRGGMRVYPLKRGSISPLPRTLRDGARMPLQVLREAKVKKSTLV